MTTRSSIHLSVHAKRGNRSQSVCLGSSPSPSVETPRCPSCAVTLQVSVKTTPRSCHVTGSLTREAPLLQTITQPSSTPPFSIHTCVFVTSSYRVYTAFYNFSRPHLTFYSICMSKCPKYFGSSSFSQTCLRNFCKIACCYTTKHPHKYYLSAFPPHYPFYEQLSLTWQYLYPCSYAECIH